MPTASTWCSGRSASTCPSSLSASCAPDSWPVRGPGPTSAFWIGSSPLPRVEVLFPTAATTRQYAQLYLQLRTQGTPIPANDLWIAALVLENDVHLVSRDAHFDRLPQLPRAA